MNWVVFLNLFGKNIYQFWCGGLPAGLVGAVVCGGSAGAGAGAVLEVWAGVGLIVLRGLGQRALEEVLKQLLERDDVLVLVDQGDQLHHGGAPDVGDIVFDDIKEDLVKILGKQVPQNLILVRAVWRHRCPQGAGVRDVEDVPDQEEAVIDKVDLVTSQILLVDYPVEPVRDHEGGPGVSEHLLGPA